MRRILVAVVALTLLVGCLPGVEEHHLYFETGYEAGYADGQKDLERAVAESHEQGLKEGHTAALEEYDCLLKRPSYNEAVAFLEKDNSNLLMGNCLTLTESVNNNAKEQGIWSQAVFFNYYTGSSYGFHAIVAFDTTDKGLVYFEPQFDDEVQVTLGKSFSQMNSYRESSFDDTIMDIVVIW